MHFQAATLACYVDDDLRFYIWMFKQTLHGHWSESNLNYLCIVTLLLGLFIAVKKKQQKTEWFQGLQLKVNRFPQWLVYLSGIWWYDIMILQQN